VSKNKIKAAKAYQSPDCFPTARVDGIAHILTVWRLDSVPLTELIPEFEHPIFGNPSSKTFINPVIFNKNNNLGFWRECCKVYRYMWIAPQKCRDNVHWFARYGM